MKRAIIIENTPRCPICKDNPILGHMTGDYKEIIYNGEKYVQFERYCNSCRGKFTYQVDITLEEHHRFSFDKVEIIKENKGDSKDVDIN